MRRSGPHLTGVALVLLLLCGCVVVEEGRGPGGQSVEPHSPPAAGPASTGEQRMARAVFDRVNDEREARGRPPVEWNDQLADVARQWSAEMARTARLAHQDMRELLQREELAGFRAVGENVFTASAPVPAGTIHAGWMQSDSHRGNVLNPGWDRLGVGIVCAGDGSVWATQEFGRTAGADLPPVSQETPPAQPLARPQDDGPTCQ
jgi:uncharacterized protein YkwD